MANVIRIKSQKVPRQLGELGRLKVIRGPDTGVVFALTAARATIGRGDNSDVILTDLKASRAHAEIQIQGGVWSVKDLGSANGIEINERQSRGDRIKTGDRIGLGETLFEFIGGEAPTRMLIGPGRTQEDVERESRAQQQNQVRLQALTTIGGLKAAANVFADRGDYLMAKANQNRRVVFLAAIIAVLAFFFFYNTENERAKSGVRKLASTQEDFFSLDEFLPKDESPELKRTANHFFRAGFREFRSGNYLRAKLSFETALQVNPSDLISKIYLENCNKAIQNEVDFHMVQGKKGEVSGKYYEARGHFESVLRLMNNDPASNTYKEAKESLENLKKLIEGRT